MVKHIRERNFNIMYDLITKEKYYFNKSQNRAMIKTMRAIVMYYFCIYKRDPDTGDNFPFYNCNLCKIQTFGGQNSETLKMSLHRLCHCVFIEGVDFTNINKPKTNLKPLVKLVTVPSYGKGCRIFTKITLNSENWNKFLTFIRPNIEESKRLKPEYEARIKKFWYKYGGYKNFKKTKTLEVQYDDEEKRFDKDY